MMQKHHKKIKDKQEVAEGDYVSYNKNYSILLNYVNKNYLYFLFFYLFCSYMFMLFAFVG